MANFHENCDFFLFLLKTWTESTLHVLIKTASVSNKYRKVPKFSDARKLRFNLPKIQTKRLNLRVFPPKDATGIANSEDPDQTAPQGAV